MVICKNISLFERSVGHVIFVYRLAAFFEDCMPFLCPAQKGKYCQATAIGKLTGLCIVRGRLSHLSSFPGVHLGIDLTTRKDSSSNEGYKACVTLAFVILPSFFDNECDDYFSLFSLLLGLLPDILCFLARNCNNAFCPPGNFRHDITLCHKSCLFPVEAVLAASILETVVVDESSRLLDNLCYLFIQNTCHCIDIIEQ